MSETTTTPSNDDIEKVIQMATQAAQNDARTTPLRDTRTQLFVANLPYRVRWQDLKDLFRRAGTVLRADVSLGPDNRSRGYGTVLLATAEDAGRAVDMFSGYSWQGRVLEVRADRLRDFDQPFPELEEEYTPMGRNLFVGNLPFHVQWQDLKDLFRQAGTIVRADVALGPDGRSRGFGTVVFATEKDARRAVDMFSGYEFNGRALKVHYDKFSQVAQPFDLGLPSSSTSFDPGLNSDYANEVFAASHPLLQSRLFDLHEPSRTPQPWLAQLQSQIQQLQLDVPASLPSSLQPQAQLQPQPLDPQPPEPPLSLPASPRSSRSSMDAGAPSTDSFLAPAPAPAPAPSKRSPASPHPHHPGPIALPPPPALPAAQGSPYTVANAVNNGAAAFNPPAYTLTPVGLPPITPSMPPFSFHPMPSPHQQPTSYFGMGPATPTHAHFLNMTPLATPTSPFFPAYVMNPPPSPGAGQGPAPALNGMLGLGPPSVGTLSPGAFYGRPGEGGAFGAPGAVGQPPPGSSLPHAHPPQHPAFVHRFGGSPGVFGMYPVEPKSYFDLAPVFPSGGGADAVEKEIMKPASDKEDGGERTDDKCAEGEDEVAAAKAREGNKAETTLPPAADVETPAQADEDDDDDDDDDLATAPPDAFKGRRHSSHDNAPPMPVKEGRRAPPPPLQLFNTESR
ncbi:hypothetical protein GGX14DRAFT_459409 [Mycena pura]|uniref:RRM domain-containing protein n=1 Tax=Mycena pura TaxID=153505 RepID=A0AAD6V7I2_9AGAR|nr:hypothetical protein GGX14DRAFT_459409 [Mycena pura]